MVVYEATTKKYYQKIIDFVKRQSEDSFVKLCWKHGHKGYYKPQFFAEYREKHKGLQLFICEDENGEIRVVWGRTLTKVEGMERYTTTSRLGFMKHEDYEAENLKYLREMWDFLVEYDYRNYGVIIRHHLIPRKYLKFAKEHFGDSLQIINIRDIPLYGKAAITSIDIRKFRGRKFAL